MPRRFHFPLASNDDSGAGEAVPVLVSHYALVLEVGQKYFLRNLGPRVASFCYNKSIFITKFKKNFVYAQVKKNLQLFHRQILPFLQKLLATE
jgi:hypothetical protein